MLTFCELHQVVYIDRLKALAILGWPTPINTTRHKNATPPALPLAPYVPAHLQLCKRPRRLGLRGTSPLRRQGQSAGALSYEDRLRTRAPLLLRNSRKDAKPMGSGEDAQNGSKNSNTRPWTTGEINYDESLAGSRHCVDGTTRPDGLPRQGDGLLCRVRSVDGISMSPSPAGLDALEREAKHSDDARVPFIAEKYEDASATDDQPGGAGQPCIDGAFDSDDADDNKTDFEGVELCAPKQMPRRVSFADEQALDDPAGGTSSSVDSSDQHSGKSQQREGWGAQRRRMSSFIGSSNGYLDGSGGIYGQLLDKDGRRRSDIERCRQAVELARAAHELLFTDTRPDGLRPITGSPMAGGRDALGSGGLYVGLAGLKGFDLSFVCALPTNQSCGGQYLRSISARLAASRRLSASTAAGGEETGTVYSPPEEPPSKAGTSWIAQGFLLDRKPGSLRPRLPRSARCPSSLEAAQIPPAPTGGGACGAADCTAGNDLHISSSGSPNAASCSDLQGPHMPEPILTLSPTQPTNPYRNVAGLDSPSVALLEQNDTRQPPGILYRSKKHASGSEGRRGSRGGTRREGAKSEDDGKSDTVVSELPEDTTAVSKAATAMASMFAPKAAVLWSARDLGVEELVFSIAGDQEVKAFEHFTRNMFVYRRRTKIKSS